MRQAKAMMKDRKGFTLVELIIVIAILGILATIAVPSIFGYVKQSQIKADVTTAKAIENAIKVSIVMKKDKYLENSNGDLNTNAEVINDLKNDAIQQLGGGNMPEAKLDGYDFYVYIAKDMEYKVIAWDGANNTGLEDNFGVLNGTNPTVNTDVLLLN